MKKKATKKEREHMNNVASIGCVACYINGYGFTPAEIHHCKDIAGERRDHNKVIGLCPAHHRSQVMGIISRHGDPRGFMDKYGTDKELLDIVELLII